MMMIFGGKYHKNIFHVNIGTNVCLDTVHNINNNILSFAQ